MIAAFLLAMALGFQPKEPPAVRPNILWITCEDMSPDLGCFGAPDAHTPNLDRLAAEGTRFTRCFSVAGVCAPSRSCLITGMYPTTLGTCHMRINFAPPDPVRAFPAYLREAGYYCTNNNKQDYNFTCPPGVWDENGKQAHWKNRPKRKPFFAVFNLTVTHESQIRATPTAFVKQTRELRSMERHDPARANLPPYYPDTPTVRRDWANYQDLIVAMDKQAGRLLEELERAGLAENTIVFFFSDHGRGLPRAKRWLYDSGIHVPLLVRWPGKLARGSLDGRLVSFVDMAPTVLSVCGARAPEHLQGQVFLGPKAAKPRDYVFAARGRMDETYDIIRAVRDERYKLIVNFEPEKSYAQHLSYMDEMPTCKEMRRLFAEGQLGGPQLHWFAQRKPFLELYDVVNDPHEINNLSPRAATDRNLAKIEKSLFDRLVNWMGESGDVGLLPEPELHRRQLKLKPVRNGSSETVLQLSIDQVRSLVAVRMAGIGFANLSPANTAWRNLDSERASLFLLPRRIAQDENSVESAALYWQIVAWGHHGQKQFRDDRLKELGQYSIDERPFIRLAAAVSLIRMGHAASGMPTLAAVLRDADEWTQLLALNEVCNLPGDVAPLRTVIEPLLRSPSDYVRRKSAEAVVRCQSAAASSAR